MNKKMGIAKLIPFLKEKKLLQTFTGWPAGSYIAVDVPIFAHKFIYTERTYDNLEARFLLWANELRTKQCEPIFVFDGERLGIKDDERLRRAAARQRTQFLAAAKRSRFYDSVQDVAEIQFKCPALEPALAPTVDMRANVQSVALVNESVEPAAEPAEPAAEPAEPAAEPAEPANGSEQPDELNIADVFTGIMVPTRHEYTLLRLKLEANGFYVAQAKFEAEAKCAHLVSIGTAWCTLTEDTDALAFGCPRTVLKFFSEEPLMADLNLILNDLQFSHDQFIDLCCLFGTDFCENIFSVGPKGAYDLMKKHGSANVILEKEYPMWKPKTKESCLEFMAAYPEAFKCFQSSGFEKA